MSYGLSCLFANNLFDLPDFKVQSFEIDYTINAIPYAVVEFDITSSAANQRNLEATRGGVDLSLKLNGKAVFKGVVTRQEVISRGNTLRLRITARHWFFALTLGTESRVFGGPDAPPMVTDNMIVMKVLNDRIGGLGLREARTLGLDAEHVQLVQHGVSDWHFVRARVAANRAWCVPTLEGYRIEAPPLPQPVMLTGGGALLLDYKDSAKQKTQAGWWRFADEGRDLVSANAWSVAEQAMAPQPKTGSNTPFALGPLDAYKLPEIADRALQVNRSAPLRPKAQQGLADGMQMARQLEAAQGSFTFAGHEAHLAYRIGKMVTVKNFGPRLDGTAPITSIRHVGDAGGWVTTLSVGLERPLSDVLSPAAHTAVTHVGVVVNYPPAADANFQLAIKIPALGQGNLWARLCSPLASAQSGLYLFPEVGDEVLLQFIDGDMSYPVIVGSLYSAKQPVPAAFFPKTGVPIARGLVSKDELLLKGSKKTTIVGQAVEFKQS